MSIKKRLLLSNAGMVLIPVVGFFILEIILGYFMFVVFQGDPQGTHLKMFLLFRFIGIFFILIMTNGLLTFFISRSIIDPITKLKIATEEIGKGNLDIEMEPKGADELAQLLHSFKEMSIKLRDSHKAQATYEKNRKVLVANISHDLRTPLTSIQGYVHGIQDGVADTPEKLQRYMTTINEKTVEMDHLIDELFLYSKLDMDREVFTFEKVDIAVFLEKYINELKINIGNDISIKLLKPAEQEFTAHVDSGQLKRVIANIVQNSIKYMDKKSQKITIQLRSEANFIHVEVHDNGSGIQEENLPFIFDGFYRTDASRNSTTGGSGLGLAIVKKIVEVHGGTVWAESTLDEGTGIHFTLRKVRK